MRRKYVSPANERGVLEEVHGERDLGAGVVLDDAVRDDFSGPMAHCGLEWPRILQGGGLRGAVGGVGARVAEAEARVGGRHHDRGLVGGDDEDREQSGEDSSLAPLVELRECQACSGERVGPALLCGS